MKIRVAAAAGLVAAAAILQSGVGRAEAPDPEALKVAQELVALTVTDGVRAAIINTSWPQVERSLRVNPMGFSEDEIAALKADFFRLLGSELDKIMADTPQIYTKYLSVTELRDTLAFYQTESGRKSLAVLPAMTTEIMQRTQERAPAMMQRIMISFGELLKKRGVKTP